MNKRAMQALASMAIIAMNGCQSSVPVESLSTQARPEGAIVGGRSFDGLPAVGAIARADGVHWCTGTLVAPRAVITAAHCLYGREQAGLEFRVGPVSGLSNERIKAARLVPHPFYRPGSFNYDIGIMVLERDASVEPMSIAGELSAEWEGRELFFVGYGITDGVTRQGAGRKRSVVMPIAEIRSDRYVYSTEGKNTCTGDSGGPAFWQSAERDWLLTGVVSHGDGPCVEWGVNTRADVYRSFLEPYLPEPLSDCGNVSFRGECDGQLLRWCEDNELREVDCAERQETCMFDETNGYFDCEPVDPPDPCDGETAVGRCDDQVLIWCENGAVNVIDCEPRQQVCVFDEQRGYYNCLSP
ncbi:MAG: trypsin-like serine protease [Myxococcota bacterium]